MITLFGTTYFTIGAGLIVLVLATPLLLWFSFWLLRPNIEGKPRSTRWLAVGGTTLALLLLTAVGLFWDVYLIGQRAKELCAQTGLLVHRQVRSEGFVGSADISTWSKHGFKYLETAYSDKKYRHELDNSEPTRIRVNNFESNYRVDSINGPKGLEGKIIEEMIRQRGARIVEVDTNDIIAELSKYSIAYGWLDRLVIGLTGFVANARVCGRTAEGQVGFDKGLLDVNDLVIATIKPK